MPEKNETIQQTDTEFMVPVAAAYLVVCITWWVSKYLAGEKWESEEKPETDHRWLDLLMMFVGIVGVFAAGQAYRAGLRIPDLPQSWQYLTVAINLCIPFLPLFFVLLVRRQSFLTIWISWRAIHWKLATGILSAIVGLATWLTIGNQWERLGEIARDSVTLHSLAHAMPVFMEGVAIAFVFVRLRWVAPNWLAILIPSLLFAAAHIPRFTETDQSLLAVAIFVGFNTAVAAMAFTTALRARDIIWIAIPHYIMDIAIGAFH